MKKVDLASVRPNQPDWELENCISAFETAFLRDPSVNLADYLPDKTHPGRNQILVELIRVEMELVWESGEERLAESYLRKFPCLAEMPAARDIILGEESRLRRIADQKSSPKAVSNPATFKQSIAIAVQSSEFDQENSGSEHREHTEFPSPGDEVAGFRVAGELGRGAFGRVYLAKQSGLADRLVALKVSAKFPAESQTMARLQHASIVPVYSTHRHQQFHVICMPFLGSTTVGDLIKELHGAGRTPSTGREVAGTISRRHARTLRESSEPVSEGSKPEPGEIPQTFPPSAREFYGRSNFVDLALWMGAELADGLAHAHERGILHRDIKPANILISDEGRPMLLDFNLASAGESDRDTIGGTLRYMAPEALDRVLGSKTAPDARSDVYSLGLVLHELLVGKIPFVDPGDSRDQSIAAMRDDRQKTACVRIEPAGGITPAIASIIGKSLAPDASKRYQSAADMRDDLRHQLANRRLQHAPDRSPIERAQKWSRRHPRLSSWVTVSSVAGVLLCVVLAASVSQQTRYARVEAENRLAVLDEDRRRVVALISDRSSPTSELIETAAITRAALADYPKSDDPNWSAHPLIRPLDTRRKSDLTRHLGEMLYRLAGAEILLAQRIPSESETRLVAAKEAIKASANLITNEGQARLLSGQDELVEALRTGNAVQGSSRRFEADEREQLNRFYREGASEGGSGRFWLALGRLHLALREVSQAQACLRVASELQPNDPWTWYHLGNAAIAAREFAPAVRAFSRCIELKSDVPEAVLNRAIAKIGLDELRSAIDDLNQIETHALRFPRLLFVREAAKRRLGDLKGADRDRATGIALQPTDAAGWIARGEARQDSQPSDPSGAASDFRTAIEQDPSMPQGYQNLANVLSESLNKPDEAVEILNLAIERFPWYGPARSGRAVLLARLGKSGAARKDAEEALRLEPTAITHYQAGCVYLLTAAGADDRTRGIGCLQKALRLEPAWALQMKDDPDLNSVRRLPAFLRLTEAASIILGAVPAG